MIILFLIVSLVITFLGFIRYEKRNYKDGLLGLGLTVSGATILALIILLSNYTQKFSIDDNIALHELQNEQIQIEISNIVETYQSHESEVFVTEASPIVLVETYPELKSNELVLKQIDLYVENNKTIMELKEEKNNLKIIGWWLFFNIGASYE